MSADDLRKQIGPREQQIKRLRDEAQAVVEEIVAVVQTATSEDAVFQLCRNAATLQHAVTEKLSEEKIEQFTIKAHENAKRTPEFVGGKLLGAEFWPHADDRRDAPAPMTLGSQINKLVSRVFEESLAAFLKPYGYQPRDTRLDLNLDTLVQKYTKLVGDLREHLQNLARVQLELKQREAEQKARDRFDLADQKAKGKK